MKFNKWIVEYEGKGHVLEYTDTKTIAKLLALGLRTFIEKQEPIDIPNHPFYGLSKTELSSHEIMVARKLADAIEQKEVVEDVITELEKRDKTEKAEKRKEKRRTSKGSRTKGKGTVPETEEDSDDSDGSRDS